MLLWHVVDLEMIYGQTMRILLFLFFFCLANLASAEQAEVRHVVDGDTLLVVEERKFIKIRLANIDAPEHDQPYGNDATKMLEKYCPIGSKLAYDPQDIDKYGRTVANVRCGKFDVNKEMVRSGAAWVYEKYNRDSSLMDVQAAAKKGARGLWREGAIPPWEWRHRSERSTALSSDICHTGPRGGRYRIVNGRKIYGC